MEPLAALSGLSRPSALIACSGTLSFSEVTGAEKVGEMKAEMSLARGESHPGDGHLCQQVYSLQPLVPGGQ